MTLTPLLLAALASTRPAMLEEIRVEQRLGAQVPLEAAFRDSAGARVRLGDTLGGRPVVLVLAYYECPMLCTMVLNGAMRAMNAAGLSLGEDYQAVTVSIDPRDTPEAAAKKRKGYLDALLHVAADADAAGLWPFLVGEEASIRAVADAVGFRYAYDETSGQYAHASAIMILTPEGKVSRYLYGVDYSARDLRLALVEAGAGGIGSLADEILLQCFRWDPTTGRYSFAVLGALRLLGTATVLVLGGFIVISLWRDRRRRLSAVPGAGGGSP